MVSVCFCWAASATGAASMLKVLTVCLYARKQYSILLEVQTVPQSLQPGAEPAHFKYPVIAAAAADALNAMLQAPAQSCGDPMLLCEVCLSSPRQHWQLLHAERLIPSTCPAGACCC